MAGRGECKREVYFGEKKKGHLMLKVEVEILDGFTSRGLMEVLHLELLDHTTGKEDPF